MDALISPVSGAAKPYTPPAKIAEAAPASPAPVAPVSVPPAAAGNAIPESSGSQYEAAIRQAALSFKNVYAVSDQQFSIFKDASGKYITRYVSLRDGKVTYVPEPTLVKDMQLSNPSPAPFLLAISA